MKKIIGIIMCLCMLMCAMPIYAESGRIEAYKSKNTGINPIGVITSNIKELGSGEDTKNIVDNKIKNTENVVDEVKAIANTNNVAEVNISTVEHDTNKGLYRLQKVMQRSNAEEVIVNNIREIGNKIWEADVISDSWVNGKWKLTWYDEEPDVSELKNVYWYSFYDDDLQRQGYILAVKE